MCGIVSVIAPWQQPEREVLVGQMCQLLAHRGPDDQGVFSSSDVPLTLGHRRLSIIDLSPDGHQPMRRGDLWLSYNGEVYNYVELRAELAARGHAFHTSSDTEVLLAAFQQWGEAALDRVNGMFAILLYDAARRRLRLYRDRFGVKPLYYLHDAGRRIFLSASEPKAVLHAAARLGVPIAADREVLACYLADAPTEEGERTFFAPLRRLPPGEAAEVDLSEPGLRLSRWRWYTLSPHTCGVDPAAFAAPRGHLPGPAAPQAAGDARFLELLTDAVRVRLRSDVPVGTCLSGGLDSSSIVCLAALRLGVHPRAFSAVYGAGDAADESRFIDLVTAHAGVPGERVDPKDHFSPEALLRFISLHDEPIGGTTVWAQHCVFRLARQHGVVVMLDGQGADEALTGYHGAFRPLHASLLRRLALPALARELFAAAALHGRPVGAAALGSLVQLGRDAVVGTRLYERHLRRRWDATFAAANTPGFRLPVPPPPPVAPGTAAWAAVSPLHAYLYQLLFGSSLQTILRYEDRNSMAASIEARAPFLDYRLVQHCLAQPPWVLVEGGYTKALLRRSLRGILPDAVRLRRDKIGFATPESAWLRGPLRPVLDDLLASRSMAQRDWFDVPILQTIFRRLAGERSTASTAASYTLFKALNVELWLRENKLAGA